MRVLVATVEVWGLWVVRTPQPGVNNMEDAFTRVGLALRSMLRLESCLESDSSISQHELPRVRE